MKSFASSTLIDAAPEKVWRILTDAAAYPSWNTTVSRVDGRIALGETVTVHAKIAPGRAFPVSVTAFNAPTRMVWSSAMPLGLFKGERVYTLCPSGNDGAEFSMPEDYTGSMAPLITRAVWCVYGSRR